MDVSELVFGNCDSFVHAKYQQALERVKRTIQLFGAERTAFSFNGGKDSTVVLHLLRAAVVELFGAACNEQGLLGVHTFFFSRTDDFAEVDEFVHEANQQYNLRMEVFDGDFKSGLESLIARTGVQAIFLGTRRGDPNAGDQEIWCPSSAGWPPFMRVNPVLDWAYPDVWAFLRGIRVPYCSLYDVGYTSLGGKSNTARNSALEREDGSYSPAYLLADSRLERAGRTARLGNTKLNEHKKCGTAALVVIGDEIMKGKVADMNTPFLSRALHSLGWSVPRIVMLPDDIAAISHELRTAHQAYDVVITSGGVGPTLDDVTMAAVADALDCQLARNPDMEATIRNRFKQVTEAHLKMADTPADNTTLIEYKLDDGSTSPFPLVLCGGNIYVLPGVPHLLQQKWKAVQEHLQSRSHVAPFRSVSVRLIGVDEPTLAPILDTVAEQAGSSVTVGSYPVTAQHDGAGVILCLESKDQALVQRAHQLLLEKLPAELVRGVSWDSASLT